jgi:hypothetical protein
MGLLDILQSALSAKGDGLPTDQVTQTASSASLGAGLADAMHSDQTPPFGDFVSQLFGNSSSGQQAGLLNQLLATLGPAALSGVAGGVLGKLMAPGQTQLTPEQAAQVSPEDAAAIASHAETQQPGIVDQVAQFYSQHASLINTLGAAALAFTAARVKDHQKA